MFKRNLLFTLAILLLIGAASNSLADDKIKIRLHQPAPNQLGVKELWKLDITNTTRENINIYLTGTATESKKGLIVSGKSKVITVSPGKKTYDYNDFKNGEVNWKDKSVQEILLRTGNVAEGEYTICVTAFYENNEVADQESCIEQSIKQTGSITLISPEDGAEINPEQPVVFTWTPLPNAKEYTLKIVELKGDQSPDVAIKQNRPIFEKENIKSTTFQGGPINGVDVKLGMKYAWMVSSGDANSDVWTFSMMSPTYMIIVDTVIIRCDSLKPNCYFYTVKIRNNNALGSPGPTITANTAITSTVPSATITPAYNTYSPVVYPGFIWISGSICFSSPTTSVLFVVKMEDASQPAIYNATTAYTVVLPRCNKNCCEGFIKDVRVVAMNPTSTPGAYKLDLILTAGPLKIKKVVGFMSYVGWRQSNEACKKCVNTSLYWGNINNVPSPTLAGFSTIAFTPSGSINSYSHEVIWSGGSVNMTGGIPVSMYVMFPPQSLLTCCADTIDFCMKFEFTDSLCVTCDTSFCFRKIRTPQTGLGIRFDERMELEKINKELEKEQPIENEEEYKRNKEEQDELMKKKDGEGQALSSSKHKPKAIRKSKNMKGIK